MAHLIFKYNKEDYLSVLSFSQTIPTYSCGCKGVTYMQQAFADVCFLAWHAVVQQGICIPPLHILWYTEKSSEIVTAKIMRCPLFITHLENWHTHNKCTNKDATLITS
jgi:hypothetical protein